MVLIRALRLQPVKLESVLLILMELLDELKEQADVEVVYPTDGMPYVPEGVAAFANAENTEAAKAFIKWFFSDDENMKMLAEIDHKNTCLLVKPSIEGLELDFDQSKLMKEDLSLLEQKELQFLISGIL